MPKIARGNNPHTFTIGQEVMLVERRRARHSTSLRNLRGKRLKVVDVMPVAPGEQQLAGHHQRVKVQAEGTAGQTDWISGAWFGPVK